MIKDDEDDKDEDEDDKKERERTRKLIIFSWKLKGGRSINQNSC